MQLRPAKLLTFMNDFAGPSRKMVKKPTPFTPTSRIVNGDDDLTGIFIIFDFRFLPFNKELRIAVMEETGINSFLLTT